MASETLRREAPTRYHSTEMLGTLLFVIDSGKSWKTM
jgi:hypothetical protein